MNHLSAHFLLDDSVTFLNHGSFGACPKPIFENFIQWQYALEREPVQFITKKAGAALKIAKTELGDYLGCAPDTFFFVPNPTTAVNQIVKSLDLRAGDEVLTTNLEYGAMDKTFSFYAKKKGFKYVRQHIPLPITSKEDFLTAFWEGYTPNTKVVFISQITSSTALILPVKEICEKAKALGLITIVDGAHVPGHIPLNISELKADFYTGTLHKWMLAPKGSSFLYAHKDNQHLLEPLIVSWGYESATPSDSKLLDENEVQGTRDISAFLCTPKVLSFLKENNWDEVSSSCKSLVLNQYQRFCDLLNSYPLCPITSEWLGQMASIPIKTPNPIALKEALYHQHQIEIPVMAHERYVFLRFSIQAYNSVEDLNHLEKALIELKKEGLIIG